MKMRISSRLGLGFAAMLMLVVVTAVAGILSLNRIGDSATLMAQQARQSAALGSIHAGLQAVETSLLEVCESPSEQGRSNVRLLLATVNGEITDFQHPMRSPSLSLAQFLASNPEAAQSCAAHCHDHPSALDLETKRATFEETVEAYLAQTRLQAVHLPSARTQMDGVTTAVLLATDKLAQEQLVSLAAQQSAVRQVESSTRTFMFAAAIVAAILGALLAITITRSITGPLSHLVAVSDKISTGELDTPVPVAGKDEIGELAEAMERMRISIKALVERMRARSGG